MAVVNDKELARFLDPSGKVVSSWVVRKWRLEGGLPFFQIGKRIFFNTESVGRWLKEQEQEHSGLKQMPPTYGVLRRIE
ncbi:helix-turn-helix domain-containing protein [Anaeroarcus burkinensis]|uniref:helix-turn-helix domain-containing protein n=1 Tax=Anaeroarcus burkinensis TaxID=82376 RepID=UPI000561C395|nr:helix-turn-helix domain-containing protein [Anaeroarcus burkinensis]